jgi:hypothetical protein
MQNEIIGFKVAILEKIRFWHLRNHGSNKNHHFRPDKKN